MSVRVPEVLSFLRPDGTYLTRLEAEQLIREKWGKSSLLRVAASQILQIPKRAAYGMIPSQLIHLVLDLLIERGEVEGEILGVDPLQFEMPEYNDQFRVRLTGFVHSGQALPPEKGDGVVSLPQQPQPQLQGYTPPSLPSFPTQPLPGPAAPPIPVGQPMLPMPGQAVAPPPPAMPAAPTTTLPVPAPGSMVPNPSGNGPTPPTGALAEGKRGPGRPRTRLPKAGADAPAMNPAPVQTLAPQPVLPVAVTPNFPPPQMTGMTPGLPTGLPAPNYPQQLPPNFQPAGTTAQDNCQSAQEIQILKQMVAELQGTIQQLGGLVQQALQNQGEIARGVAMQNAAQALQISCSPLGQGRVNPSFDLAQVLPAFGFSFSN